MRLIFRFLYASVRHRSLTQLFGFSVELEIIIIQKSTPRYQQYEESQRNPFKSLNHPFGIVDISLVEFLPNCSFKGVGSPLKVH